jgi:5'(3')-deoxyribonucleotidase
MVAALVLGATLSAAAFYQYLHVKEVGFQETELRMIADLENKQAELDETKRQLEQVQSERDVQMKKADMLSRRLDKMSPKERGDIKNLDNESKILRKVKVTIKAGRTKKKTIRKSR